jgi:hypothetical protein
VFGLRFIIDLKTPDRKGLTAPAVRILPADMPILLAVVAANVPSRLPKRPLLFLQIQAQARQAFRSLPPVSLYRCGLASQPRPHLPLSLCNAIMLTYSQLLAPLPRLRGPRNRLMTPTNLHTLHLRPRHLSPKLTL